MGSLIEFNDTLKLKRGAGFPSEPTPGVEYSFELEGIRVFHLYPVRVHLVEEIEGKWLHRGAAMILQLKQDAQSQRTSGVFRIEELYPESVALIFSEYDSPKGKGFGVKE